MKKEMTLRFALLLMAAACMTFTACSGGDDEEEIVPPANGEAQGGDNGGSEGGGEGGEYPDPQINYNEGSNTSRVIAPFKGTDGVEYRLSQCASYQFTYDTEGQLASVDGNHVSNPFSWSASSEMGDAIDTYNYSITRYDYGFLRSYRYKDSHEGPGIRYRTDATFTFTYDGNGHVSKIQEEEKSENVEEWINTDVTTSSTTYSCTWEGDNLVKLVVATNGKSEGTPFDSFIDEESGYSYTTQIDASYTFEYQDVENVTRQPTLGFAVALFGPVSSAWCEADRLVLLGLLGKAPKNFLKSVTVVSYHSERSDGYPAFRPEFPQGVSSVSLDAAGRVASEETITGRTITYWY